MTAPRVKYEPPRMHESLRTIPTPKHLAPFIPRPRLVHTALLIDTGYQPFAHVPARLPCMAKPAPVVVEIPEPPRPSLSSAWPCVDCHTPFVQKSKQHVRCTDCGIIHRRGRDRARKTTDITRTRSGPRAGRRRAAA